VGVATEPLDPRGEAVGALRTIAANPQYGPAALSSAPMMTSLLKDLLPDAPLEANVLIAAAGAGIPGTLQGYLAQGMDARMASQLAARTLAERTALTDDACAWATGSLAAVLAPRPITPDTRPMAARGSGVTGAGVTGAEPTAPVAAMTPARPSSRRVTRAGLAAAALAWAGALGTVLACSFSFIHVYNDDGTYEYSASLFNLSSDYGGAWHWIGLVVAAVLAAVAGVLLVLPRAPWLRSAAGGLIAALGIGTGFVFAAYQFTIGPVNDGSGPAGAEKLGVVAGLLMVVAGVIGIAVAARDSRGTAGGSAAGGPVSS
jgi:hypothetical protein